jgi:hypothetical protein
VRAAGRCATRCRDGSGRIASASAKFLGLAQLALAVEAAIVDEKIDLSALPLRLENFREPAREARKGRHVCDIQLQDRRASA